MPLECVIINDFQAHAIWARIAPHPQRLKEGLSQAWRLHVEGRSQIFLIDEYYIQGTSIPTNNHSQSDLTSQTGMTAWIHTFGNIEITTKDNGAIVATMTLQTPPENF